MPPLDTDVSWRAANLAPSRARRGRLAIALWLALCGAAAAQPSGLVAVSSEKDDAITLLDARTLAVTGTVKVCKRPRHLQMLPAPATGPRVLLVACADSARADRVDLTQRKVVGSVALGDDPEIFDLSPDGRRLYVSDEENGRLNVIDLVAGKKVGEVAVGAEPEGVKVSPDGARIYVTSEVANLVHVVDARTLAVVKNIPVGQRPRRFAFANGGAELWVSNELGASVSVISTRDLAVTHTLAFAVAGLRADDITPVGLVTSHDGRTVFVGLGRANRVAWVDAATKSVRGTVLVGRRAWGLALDREGKRLFVANGLSDDITVVDVSGSPPGKALRSIPVGRVPHSIVVDD